MGAYILRRLIQSALILLGVSFITFFLLFVPMIDGFIESAVFSLMPAAPGTPEWRRRPV